MSFKIISIPSFDKELKGLPKKHRSIPKDYEKLLDDLEENPKMGDEIIQNCFKIRMAITSKRKEKEKVVEPESLLSFTFKMKRFIYFPLTTNPIKKIFLTKNFVI